MKTLLRKPNRGQGIVSTKLTSEVFMIFLVYCIVSLFSCMFVLSPALSDIFHTPLARFGLFALKVQLNDNCLFLLYIATTFVAIKDFQ